eukprot:c26226_g2_i1 orf=569-718(-)
MHTGNSIKHQPPVWLKMPSENSTRCQELTEQSRPPETQFKKQKHNETEK